MLPMLPMLPMRLPSRSEAAYMLGSGSLTVMERSRVARPARYGWLGGTQWYIPRPHATCHPGMFLSVRRLGPGARDAVGSDADAGVRIDDAGGLDGPDGLHGRPGPRLLPGRSGGRP